MATKKEILDNMIRPVVEGLGYECWGIEFFAQGKRSVLRIFIESKDGIDATSEQAEEMESGIGIEDCEKVSRQLSGVLDVEDPIAGDYALEVSSPGMDRTLFELHQYERFSGHTIELRLRMAFEGQRKFKGLLKGVEGEEVVLIVDDGEYLFPIESIEKAKIVPRFD